MSTCERRRQSHAPLRIQTPMSDLNAGSVVYQGKVSREIFWVSAYRNATTSRTSGGQLNVRRRLDSRSKRNRSCSATASMPHSGQMGPGTPVIS
jgi:hypothetical protein